MMSSQNSENTTVSMHSTPRQDVPPSIQTIIIYKTYTPQRKAYAQTYYQKNKENLKSKQKDYYEQIKDDIKQRENFKEKKQSVT